MKTETIIHHTPPKHTYNRIEVNELIERARQEVVSEVVEVVQEEKVLKMQYIPNDVMMISFQDGTRTALEDVIAQLKKKYNLE